MHTHTAVKSKCPAGGRAGFPAGLGLRNLCVFAFCPSVCLCLGAHHTATTLNCRYLILNVFVAVLTSGIGNADESSSDAAAMFAQSNKSQPSTGAQARPRLAAPDPAHRTPPHREW